MYAEQIEGKKKKRVEKNQRRVFSKKSELEQKCDLHTYVHFVSPFGIRFLSNHSKRRRRRKKTIVEFFLCCCCYYYVCLHLTCARRFSTNSLFSLCSRRTSLVSFFPYPTYTSVKPTHWMYCSLNIDRCKERRRKKKKRYYHSLDRCHWKVRL